MSEKSTRSPLPTISVVTKSLHSSTRQTLSKSCRVMGPLLCTPTLDTQWKESPSKRFIFGKHFLCHGDIGTYMSFLCNS